MALRARPHATPFAAPASRLRRTLRRLSAPRASVAPALVVGTHTQQGTSRKQNEDRFAQQTLKLADGGSAAYLGVFDGHGGFATAQWLTQNMAAVLAGTFKQASAAKSIGAAFLEADQTLLAPQGFMGMGARGVGGPMCGSTGLVALVYGDTLLCANVGDARAVLVQGGEATQLSYDHVPEDEQERYRIELRNPNPKKPLVQYIGSTWRVGGLLALSRAFGDAYMKASGEFEGYGTAQDDYASGFGVTAEPHVQLVDATIGSGALLVLSSDGLYANEQRGGGGGLTNERVAQLCAAMPPDADAATLKALGKAMAEEAVREGSTDDITVVVARL